MRNKQISEFFSSDFVNYSSYDNLRKIASLVDGQKNAARKILYTVLNKNIRTEIKVSQLGSKVAEYSEYLHGNLDGVITGLAQNFPGTNNLPLLVREGNFGTRFSPEPSASRYIFTHGSDEFFSLFNKEDTDILESQTFEGHSIEPKFYLPSLPLLLINGSEGVSSGFAQKILSRSVSNIKKALINMLKNKKVSDDLFIPSFEGFGGIVEQGINPAQWLIKGIATRVSVNRVKITEIPVGYDLKSYISVLDSLEEKQVIQSYIDKSDDNVFHFEVTIPSKVLKEWSDDELLRQLKLVKTVTENYTCLDEYNRIVVCESARDILKRYIDVKIPFLYKRKQYIIEKMQSEIRFDYSKYLFIKKVTEDEIILNKQKKASIVKVLDSYDEIITKDGSYDYLLRLPLYSLTSEKMKELSDSISDKKIHLDKYSKLDITDIWLSEI